MSRQYASQLLFDVSPSKNYRRIIFLCATLSILSVFILDVTTPYQMLMFLILLLLIAQALKHNKHRQLQWRPDGSWLITENTQPLSASLEQGSIVTPFFTSLNFKLKDKQSLTVLLFEDNVNADKFRQLRVRLKVEGIQPENNVLVNDD